MFRAKTLMHLLVSLALILNGVGAAAASVVVATTVVSAAGLVVSTGEAARDGQEVGTKSGCHESHDSTKPPTAKSPQDSDCCEDGTCGCGCAHQSQVVLAAEFLAMPAIAPASTQWGRLAAPLSPSLPQPVRPPIA
jgi:hypothetical protein